MHPCDTWSVKGRCERGRNVALHTEGRPRSPKVCGVGPRGLAIVNGETTEWEKTSIVNQKAGSRPPGDLSRRKKNIHEEHTQGEAKNKNAL